MSLLGVLFLIFALSAVFIVRFNYKTEESMIISVLVIVSLLTVFGLFELMNIGQYVLYVLSVFSLGFSIYLIVCKKSIISFENIFTPGTVVVILSYVIYIIMTKNNVLYIWDEANLYATATHYMSVTDTISNGGVLTTFSYFFTSFAGYSEHALFVSKWLFMWICLSVLLSDVKWDKWYIAAIFGLFAYSTITFIDPETQYLMDAPIGISAGSAIAYLALNRNKSRIAIFTGLSYFTLLLKDNISIILYAFIAVFTTIFFIVESFSSDWELTKKKIINAAIFIFAGIVAFIIKRLTVPIKMKNLLDTLSKEIILLFLLLIIIFALILLWFFVLNKILKNKILTRLNNKRKTIKSIMILFLTLIPFVIFSVVYKALWGILYTMDITKQSEFIISLNEYLTKQYFGLSLYAFIFLFLISFVIISILFVKKKYKPSLLSQAVAISIFIFLYGLMIAYLFTTKYNQYFLDGTMMGLERYIGSVFIMLLVWLISIILIKNEYWKKTRQQYVAIIMLSLTIISSAPIPGEILFSSITNTNMIANKNIVRPIVTEHSDFIRSNTPQDAKIMIVMLEDKEWEISDLAMQLWTYYECVPRPKPGILASFYDAKSICFTNERLLSKLNGYDYIYVLKESSDIYNVYKDLFETTDITKDALFFINNSETCPFVLIAER